MNFSQRHGLAPATKPLQKQSMDRELRTSLWNFFELIMLPPLKREWAILNPRSRVGLSGDFLISFWVNFLKLPLSTLPPNAPDAIDIIHDWFLNFEKTPWNTAFDFVEYVARLDRSFENDANEFVKACNIVLEREFSAYRFVGTTLTEITNESEIADIEKAASFDDSLLKPLSTHIDTALKLLADRKNPDYRNSMKESISAVEGICKIIAKNGKTTLGPALDIVASKIKLHPRLLAAFKALYSYTSDTHGIRHALKDDDQPEAEDAKFMLVSCSAFVNYLIEKARKNSLLPT